MSDATKRTLQGKERAFLIALGVWLLLQVSRAIALTLLEAIDAGQESEAWRYPAYLDLFAVVFAPPLIAGVWKRRGLLTWTAVVVYWAVSIVDHAGNFVTTAFVGPPSIAEDMNPALIPAIQTLIDLIFVVLLLVPRYRNLFFRTSAESSPEASASAP